MAYALATAYLNLGETDKAQAIFKELTDAAGDSASVHIMIGRAYQNAGQSGRRRPRVQPRRRRSTPKARERTTSLALLYLSQNEWVATPQAREQFAEEVKINPKDFFGNFFLGYVDNADKQYDDSDRYLKVAALDKPDWPEPYLYMGLNAFARHDNCHRRKNFCARPSH